MRLRAKALLCALTCLAAVLTAATLAQAVDQTAKNGCTSPQAYEGSLTSPPFVADSSVGNEPRIEFQAWFEIESVAPGSFDTMTVEYRIAAGAWTPFGELTDPAQVQPNTGGAPETPYSNNGTGVAPSFQLFNFPLPAAAQNQADVQVRIRFATGDQTYQGFRGLAVDSINIVTATGGISQGFENGAGPWTLDPPSGPGGPFWQVLTNPQNVSVASPQINPELVTLPDSGALPPPSIDGGTNVAWFGNAASGTFCGPDFASRDVAPETTITAGPSGSVPSTDATFEFTASEPAFFECQLDGGGFEACFSPQTYSGLSLSTHNFEVRATDFTGNVDATPASRTWTAREKTLADLDAPTQGVDVNVEQVSGTVLVGLRGTAARAARNEPGARTSQKGVTFVPLSEARQVPVGSFLDTRRGTVRLQSARDRRGTRQTGTFLNSLFQVRQSRKRRLKGRTDLVLKGGNFSRCRTVRRGKPTAALSRRTIRRLRANARGRFRTGGRNSSATVRGTIWDIADRCDGTLTRVRRGSVVVRDFRRKRNIVVRAGKSYLARAAR